MSVFFVAGRTGFEPATGFTQHSLSRRAHSATLAPPRFRFEGFKLADAQLVLNKPSNIWVFYHATHSGGSGIRTHVGVTQTCFQDMRLEPLGHPSIRSRHLHQHASAGAILGGGQHFTIRYMSLRACTVGEAISQQVEAALLQRTFLVTPQ